MFASTPFFMRILNMFNLVVAFSSIWLKCSEKLSLSSKRIPKYLADVVGLTMSLNNWTERSSPDFCGSLLKTKRLDFAPFSFIRHLLHQLSS